MTPTIEDLQEQVRYLRERIADITGQTAAQRIRVATGMSYRQSCIVAMLYSCPGVVSTSMIYDAVFADPATGDGPDTAVVKVAICMARKALRRAGSPELTIRHDFNFGYYLTPDFRSWLRGRLEALQPQEIAA